MVENNKYINKYNFAFIDEATKKEIRRKLLKAVAIPGYQVPYSSPEMPIARGWGTGGLHVTLAIIGKTDIFKIIDHSFIHFHNRIIPMGYRKARQRITMISLF